MKTERVESKTAKNPPTGKKHFSKLQTELLIDLVVIAFFLILIFCGRRTWKAFIAALVYMGIHFIPVFLRRKRDRSEPYAVLYWDDAAPEKVVVFLAKRQKKKLERYEAPVTLKCPIYKLEADGTIDTGFDVYIKTADWCRDDPWNAAVMRSLRVGDFITVRGHIGVIYAGFLNIEDIESIEKTAPILPDAEKRRSNVNDRQKTL